MVVVLIDYRVHFTYLMVVKAQRMRGTFDSLYHEADAKSKPQTLTEGNISSFQLKESCYNHHHQRETIIE